MVGGAAGVPAVELFPLFQTPGVVIEQSLIIPLEFHRKSASGEDVFKQFFAKFDTGAEGSGATRESAEMICGFDSKASIKGSASFVRGIGDKTVPVDTALRPAVCFQDCNSRKRSRQFLQVLVMGGATDRTHRILLGLDNIVPLGGNLVYDHGRVVGIYWAAINCYTGVTTPASAARQFSW